MLDASLDVVFANETQFGSYEAAKRAMASFEGHSDPRNISAYSKFAAGGVAGMIAQYVRPAMVGLGSSLGL